MDDSKMSPLLHELERLREAKGEEAFLLAAQNYAKEFMRQGPAGAKLARQIFTSFLGSDALDALEAESRAPKSGPGMPADQMMVEALRASMPGLRTQAQFNAFMATFDALRAVANAHFEGKPEMAAQARVALDQGIEAIRLSSDITRRLEEVPEAASGKTAEEFKRPPAQFSEYDVQRRLLTELAAIGDGPALSAWYQHNRAAIEGVVSQTLRNALIDAVREKKVTFDRLAEGV